MSVKWVCNKPIDLEKINQKITKCMITNHFTNNGKYVKKLQNTIKQIFQIDDDKEVLLVCNGAMGLNALVGGLSMSLGKKLRFAVQAFTFPCSHQSMLMDSLVLDMDHNMGPNMVELERYKDDYDGILITNCFGCSTNIQAYQDFANTNNKILLFDNAAASFTMYHGKNHLNYGHGCMVSLHHTKPIGFGEGGFIVFDKTYLESMKKTICFGYTDTDKIQYDKYASNYKMSEVAAIYIDSYLNNFSKIYEHHCMIINYFIFKLTCSGVTLYYNFADHHSSLLSTIPVIFDYPVSTDLFTSQQIEAKKYYYSLDEFCTNSVDMYNRIICLPLHMDITCEIVDQYISIIEAMILQSRGNMLM